MHIPHPSFKSHLLHLTRTARAIRKKRRRRKLPQSPSSWANSGLAPRNSSYLARRFLGCVGTGDGHPVMAVSFSTGPTLQCSEPIAAKKHGTVSRVMLGCIVMLSIYIVGFVTVWKWMGCGKPNNPAIWGWFIQPSYINFWWFWGWLPQWMTTQQCANERTCRLWRKHHQHPRNTLLPFWGPYIYNGI